METNEIRTALLDTLAQVAPEAELDRLKADRPLRDQLDIDSYDFLQWMIALHDRLQIDIPELDYPRLATLDGAVAYLQARSGASQ